MSARRPPPRYLYSRGPAREPLYYPPPRHDDHGGGLLWCTMFLVLLGFLLLVAAYPPYSLPTRPPPPVSRARDAHVEGDCRVGEYWDRTLGACVPNTPYPVALDNALLDPNTSACDSFYTHSCGAWLDAHSNSTFPEARSFDYVARQNAYWVRRIVTDPANTQVNALYRSCMTMSEQRAQTEEEIQRLLWAVPRALLEPVDVPLALAKLVRSGLGAPFGVEVARHPLRPGYIMLFRHECLFPGGQPSEEDVAAMLEGYSASPVGSARRALEIERALGMAAPAQGDIDYLVYLRGGRFAEDTMSMGAFRRRTEGFDWDTVLQHLDGHEFVPGDSQQIWVRDARYFERLAEVVAGGFSVQHWRDYATLSIVLHTQDFFPQLPPQDVYEHVAHPALLSTHRYAHMRRREEPIEEREMECVRLAQYLLPGWVAQRYLDLHYPQSTTSRVLGVAENVRTALAGMVESSATWLGPQTAIEAADKVRAIGITVGHPERWRPEPFGCDPERYAANLNRVRAYRQQQEFALWHRGGEEYPPLDQAERFGAPLTIVNAWYSPVSNHIWIPAGILHPPFFQAGYADASLYAILGSVLGHELSHSLDPTGRLFDAAGSFREHWWPADASAAYTRRVRCLEAEYQNPDPPSATCPPPPPGYGRFTAGETTADLNGVRAAYAAWKEGDGGAKKRRGGGGVEEARRRGGDSGAEEAKKRRGGGGVEEARRRGGDSGVSVRDDAEKRGGVVERPEEEEAPQHFWLAFAQTWCVASACPPEGLLEDPHAQPRYRVDTTLRNLPEFARDFNCHPDHHPMARPQPCALFAP